MDAERRRALKRAFKQDERTSARSSMILGADELHDLLDHLDEKLRTVACDDTLRLTQGWARERGVAESALAESLGRFGGHCDCEVLANVLPEEIF